MVISVIALLQFEIFHGAVEFTNATSAFGILIPIDLAVFNIEAFIPNTEVGLGFDY
jgi:hypothetical protein